MAKAKDPKKAHVDRATQDLIGRQLRAMYAELIQEPLPESLLSTLRSINQTDDPIRPEYSLRRAA